MLHFASSTLPVWYNCALLISCSHSHIIPPSSVSYQFIIHFALGSRSGARQVRLVYLKGMHCIHSYVISLHTWMRHAAMRESATLLSNDSVAFRAPCLHPSDSPRVAQLTVLVIQCCLRFTALVQGDGVDTRLEGKISQSSRIAARVCGQKCCTYLGAHGSQLAKPYGHLSKHSRHI